MDEYRGSLGGVPWVGWIAARPEDLVEFRRWVIRNRGLPVAVDTEGKGLDILCGDPEYVRLVQFGTESEAWVLPVELGSAWRESAKWALGALENITGHNWANFDAPALAAYLEMDLDTLCRKGTDTQILAKLIDPRAAHEGGIGAGLKPLSAHYIDPDAPDTQSGLTAVFRSLGLNKDTGWAGIPLFHPVYIEYAMLDVILTSRLRRILESEYERIGLRPALVPYEHEISRICAHMQWTGIVLDQDYTAELQGTLAAEAEHYARIAAELGVANTNATEQVSAALMAMGETLTERTKTGKLRVDKAVLSALADVDLKGDPLGTREPNPLAEAVLKTNRARKWGVSYAEMFLRTADADGRIHASINTLQARTGRMSITRPAVQTLPSRDKMIRRCLLADEGHVFISCDFQAIEMRVLAALANVRRMTAGFSDPAPDPTVYPDGFDIHMYTARLIKGPNATKSDRGNFKAAGLGKIYGGGIKTLARQTGASEPEMAQMVAEYNRVFPEIRRQSNIWQREALETGRAHISVTGRHLPLDAHRMYAVVNYACQSAARDVLGQSLIHMDEAGLLPYLRLPIHDEVLVSAPRAEAAEIAREIERCMTWELRGVPIVASADIGGRSWGSLYGADY